MRFTVSSTLLSSHVQALSRVLNSKNSLPILDCFLLDLKDNALFITASDGESTMITSLELSSSDNNGKVAINAKTLLESLKDFPEQPMSFNVDMDSLQIEVKYNNGEFKIVGEKADEFPSPKEIAQESTEISINSERLLNSINKVIFATADDELRPIMNGIYFDFKDNNLTLVASDGHCLSKCEMLDNIENTPTSFILAKKPASVLRSLLPKEEDDSNIKIKFDERNAMFTSNKFTMTCRLIEGRYPNYNSVIPPNNPYKVTVDRLNFLAAVKRVSVFSSKSQDLIKFVISDNTLTLSSENMDFNTSGEESVNCQYEGDNMEIGFKSSIIINILNNLSSKEVVIELADPSRAGVFIPAEQEENENLLMLLMPMMVL